jgi:hypothetical protein
VTKESDSQKEKQFTPKISTDAGRLISTKPVIKNARPSNRANLDLDSNITEESDLPPEKYFSPKTSADEGTTISTKLVSLNTQFSF